MAKRVNDLFTSEEIKSILEEEKQAEGDINNMQKKNEDDSSEGIKADKDIAIFILGEDATKVVVEGCYYS